MTGDLKGIGVEVPDARALQNAGSRARRGRSGGGRGGGGGAGNPVTVTMADGSKLEGTLVRKDDFLVILTLPDGTRKSIARNNGVPKVDVKDPNDAHKKMVLAARRSGEQEDARRDRVSVDDQVEARRPMKKLTRLLLSRRCSSRPALAAPAQQSAASIRPTS